MSNLVNIISSSYSLTNRLNNLKSRLNRLIQNKLDREYSECNLSIEVISIEFNSNLLLLNFNVLDPKNNLKNKSHLISFLRECKEELSLEYPNDEFSLGIITYNGLQNYC